MFVNVKNVLLAASLALAGVVLTGAFAPFYAWPLAIIALAYLFYVWQNHTFTAKRAFWYGWIFGLGFFTSAVSWIYISLSVFGGLPFWLAILLMALLVMFLALYPAFAGYLLNRIFSTNHKFIYLMAFACLWVLTEWLRSNMLSGFPWVLVAFSQTNSPLAGYIPWVGELGTSWLVCIQAGLLAYLCQSVEVKQLWTLIIFLAVFFLGLSLHRIEWTQPVAQGTLTVSSVQASIPQELKWNPDHFNKSLQTYNDLTRPIISSDLIIWPESAITVPVHYVGDFLAMWDDRLQGLHHSLLLGVPIQIDDDNFYNGLIVIGQNHGEYRKRHLVPFGEYAFMYPISKYIIHYFHIPMSNFTAGDKNQALIQLDHIQLATYICYEIAYESLVLRDTVQANLIINISDDSWFGHSLAAWQQVQIGQFRAIETARYAILAANDGVTAMVNPKGKIYAKLPRYVTNVLTNQVQAMQNQTPIMEFGNLTMLLLICGGLLLVICVQIYHNRTEDI